MFITLSTLDRIANVPPSLFARDRRPGRVGRLARARPGAHGVQWSAPRRVSRRQFITMEH
jgi:hypothetical protein